MPPLSILDLAPVPEGSNAGDALRNTLDLARADANDAITGREPRGDWSATQLDALWAGAALQS